MNFKEAPSINGTHLQGYVDIGYDQLVATFGQPNSDGDGYKVQAQWELEFDDGTIATIYDYKMGDNYNGPGEGISPQGIRDWHIGGFSKLAVTRVHEALGMGVGNE